MSSEELKVYFRDNGILAERFFQIKRSLGIMNDTEVIRLLINWYWKEHREEIEPKFNHVNLNEDGVILLDVENGDLTKVYFKPEGLYCEECKSNNCVHIRFALSLPKVQEILAEKGFKLKPEKE